MKVAPLAIVMAIQNGLTLTFEYKQKLRIVEPYAFGQNGLLRAYQLFPEEGWRLFDSELMHPPVASDVMRPGYNQASDKAMPEGFVAQRTFDVPALA